MVHSGDNVVEQPDATRPLDKMTGGGASTRTWYAPPTLLFPIYDALRLMPRELRRQDAVAAAGQNTITETVPAGEMWLVWSVHLNNSTTASSFLSFQGNPRNGMGSTEYARNTAPTTSIWSTLLAEPMVLHTGGRLLGVFGGCALNDSLRAEYVITRVPFA